MFRAVILIATFLIFFFVATNLSKHTIFANLKLVNFSSNLKTASNQKKIGPLSRSTKIIPPEQLLDLKSGLNQEELSARSALVFDRRTNKIIYAKGLHDRYPIASLTKIATFLVAAENKPTDTLITVSASASSQEPDSMGLFPGERLTLKQLLYGIMLVSGNDSAVAIAENVFGDNSLPTFVNKMNEKAYYLGMDNTYFANPTGFDEDAQEGYSSSYDLMLLTQAAMENPLFQEISGKRHHSIPEVFTNLENHKSFELTNTSPTIDLPGYAAGKPGFTPHAGKCQVSVVQRDGKDFIVIVLGSEDRKVDTEKMLNWAFGL